MTCEAKHPTRVLAHCDRPKGHVEYHRWRPRPIACKHPGRRIERDGWVICTACGGFLGTTERE